jgi:hypothetical protein
MRNAPRPETTAWACLTLSLGCALRAPETVNWSRPGAENLEYTCAGGASGRPGFMSLVTCGSVHTMLQTSDIEAVEAVELG